jgi:ATPase family associated with various cellular activities (AAA)
MESLAEYLQGSYLQDKAEIEAIRQRAEQILDVLLTFFDDGWPYELAVGKSPGAPAKSHSTDSMILFAIAAVTGRVTGSALVPAIQSQPLELSDEQLDRMHLVLRDGIQRLVAISGASKTRGSVTKSPTYGPNDPFTLTWFLEILRTEPPSGRPLDPDTADPLARVTDSASALVKRVFAAPTQPVLQLRRNEEAVLHAFPLLRVVQLYKALEAGGKAPAVDPTLVFRALADRLHLHISLSDIHEGAFDAGELVFSLEGWLLTNPGSPDRSIIDHCFRILAERQARDPYWRPLRPFKVTPQGLVLLPQSVEIANSLLRVCQLLPRDQADYFSRHVDLFKRYTQWLDARRFEGRTKEGRSFVGWESEHTYVPDRVHLWQTSQVLLFLQHYAAMLQRHVARTTLSRARVVVESPPKDDPAFSESEQWEAWKTNEPVTHAGPHYRMYERIGNAFVAPRLASGDGRTGRPFQSMLLYGPPGTGKSTLARELAKSLGFRFLTVTPSDFISAGPDEIEARAKAIFKMLEEQSDFVILFDEIDRLLLDRDSEWYSKQSDLFQLLTPGMLTKLNDLAKKRQSIFALATNYRERIDPAIRRAGRIDGHYLLLPPDSAQREKILASDKGVGGWLSIGQEKRDVIVRETVLFSYTELVDMANYLATENVGLAGDDLGEAVRTAVASMRPAISLKAYRARVDQADIADRKPLEEVAMLVSLILEAGASPEDDDGWVRKALSEALQEGVIGDPGLADRLRGEIGVD